MAMTAGDSGGSSPVRTRNYLSAAQRPAAAVVSPKPAPAPIIRASATAPVTYSKPNVQTYSGATGMYTPPTGNYQAPYANVRTPYQAPAAQTQQSFYQPAYQQPAQNFAPPPPPEPPRPQFAPGGRQEFLNMFNPEQRQMTEEQWLTGDSDYTAQMGQYQKALDDFVRRITGRIQGFETDATEAIAGNQKNEAMSADSLGQDFGARGLSYSGLFDTSRNKLLDRYKQGRANIDKNKTQNVQNAREEEANYKSENEISRGNAKRSSLMRMAAQQSLKDASW